MRPYNRQMSEFDVMQMNYEYSGDNPLYVGYSLPGTPPDANGWIIIKYTYSGTNVTRKRFAKNSAAFDCAWSRRTSYVYDD